MIFLLAAVLALPLSSARAPGGPRCAGPEHIATQTPGEASPPAVSEKAEAYYQFLLGWQAERAGEVDTAIRAYQRAAALDPRSAAIPAALAALYARQDRLQDAMTLAEKALALDPDNREAHRVLGLAYGALARREGPEGSPEKLAESARKAIAHLEAATGGPGLADPGVLLTLGRLYLEAGQPEKAVPVLTRLLDQVDGVPEVGVLLAEAHAATGHLDAAIRVLKDLAATEPEVNAPLGEMYGRAHRWKEAAAAYQAALERTPSNTDLQIDLAFALLNAGDPGTFPRARDLANEVLKRKGDDTRALYLLGQVQRAMRDLDGAEATARRLMAVRPNGVSGPFLLAEVYEQRGDYRKVVDLLQPLITRHEDPSASSEGTDLVRLIVHLGAAYAELGQHDEAITCFEEAGRRAPDDPGVAAALIQGYVGARRYDRAAALAEAALQRHPGDLRFPELYADALRQQGQAARAVGVMRDAVQQHPGEPSAYVGLAQLLVNANRPAEALAVARDAEGRFPNDASVQFQLGAVLERQKKYDEAEKAFKAALALDPLDAPALNYLGYMLAERGQRLAESVTYVQRALAIDPGNAAYLDSLGWAYFKLNKLDLAEANLRQAAERRLTDSVIQDHFAEVLFRLGRYREAAAAWERALAGDGEDIDRARIESRIRTARERARR